MTCTWCSDLYSIEESTAQQPNLFCSVKCEDEAYADEIEDIDAYNSESEDENDDGYIVKGGAGSYSRPVST